MVSESPQDGTGQQAAQRAQMKGEPGQPPSLSALFKWLLDLVLLLLPASVREIFQKGLLKPLIFFLVLLAVVPLLMAFLAGFWLKLLGKIDSDLVKSFRTTYLEVIQDGFSFEEVASRSNRRLDYFQWFETDLQPNKKTFKEFRISIQRNQKATVTLKTVKLRPVEGTACSLPEEDIKLISVYFEGKQFMRDVGELSGSDKPHSIEWEKSSAADSEDVRELSFKLTDEAKKLPSCSLVHIEGSVSVFKDLLSS